MHDARTEGEQTGANLRVILRAFRKLFGLYREIKKTGAAAGSRASQAPLAQA